MMVRRPTADPVELDSQIYRYFTTRSAAFYAYAKRVLAKAEVTWVPETVTELSESTDAVTVRTSSSSYTADYVLDSRPPTIRLGLPHVQATLQHFGGWFVRFARACVDEDKVVLMDFVELQGEIGFFYLIPDGQSMALVELAVFSDSVWEKARYDKALSGYLATHYPNHEYTVTEREYGVIPMTDEALWRSATPRIWPIGTRGGWVQPSSGYAFTRIERFAKDTAKRLLASKPQAWRPSAVQQIFNSTMLRYILEEPARAGEVFVNLFARNGADRTFAFLDESAGVVDTLRIMWNSPRWPFTMLALKEVMLRVLQRK